MQIKETDYIFSTGVFLKPVKCIIDGIESWRWIAIGFEDDSYLYGEGINVYDYADTLEGLVIPEEVSEMI